MRARLALLGGLMLLLALAGIAWLLRRPTAPDAANPIVIGQLQALSGPLLTSEAPLAAAARLAVEEINASGGLLGRRVELKVEDTRSDAAVAAAAAEKLIGEQHAVALFGCWSTSCREAVRGVVERRRHLLFYPMSYEGMEQSPNIVYTGATPNQLLLPATDWALHGFGRRVYIVGTEGLYARRAHALLRDFIALGGGRVLGERLVAQGSGEVGQVVADIEKLQPDFVISTLGGVSNAAFFDALVGAALADQPLLSFGAGEPEMRAFGGGRLDRHFTAWSYLQSQPGPDNADFLARLRRSQGEAAVASDPAVSVYVAVQLWAAAVREVGSEQTEAVNANVLQQSISAPQGYVAVDAQTRHLWRRLRIAQVRPDGQLNEVFALPRDIKPSPWPAFRSNEQWAATLQSLGAAP